MIFENSFNNFSRMNAHNLFKKGSCWAKKFKKPFFTKDKVLFFLKYFDHRIHAFRESMVKKG